MRYFHLILLTLFSYAASAQVPMTNNVPWYQYTNKLSVGKLQLIKAGERDTSFTLPNISAYVVLDTISADKTITFQDGASTDNGTVLFIYNSNSSAFSWNVSGNVVDSKDGSSVTTIDRGIYQFVWSGTKWFRLATGTGSAPSAGYVAASPIYITTGSPGTPDTIKYSSGLAPQDTIGNSFYNDSLYFFVYGSDGVRDSVAVVGPADASNSGLVSTGAQTFAGKKTFNGGIAVTTSSVTDTTTYKPAAIDGSGNVQRLDRWPGSGGGGTADSSSTPGYASKHYSDSTSALIFSAKPWPNEDSVGVIYHKENWADLYDFTAKSTGTASVALSSGKVTITSTSVNWNNNIIINSNRPTTLERWKFTARVKLGTLSGTTTGIGVGGVRSGSSNTAWIGYVNTTTGGSNGLLTLAKDDGTATLTTGAGAALATGDSIEIQMERLDSTIYFRVRNITTNSATTTISYTFLSTSTTTLMAQNMNWAFVQFSSAVNTIYYIDITSDSKRNPNLLVLGDSKTQYAYASYWNTRYAKQLGNYYPSVSINAAGNDRITDLLSRIEEISKQNGQQILLSIGSNDVRAGTTFTTIIGNYADLVRRLEVGGAKVYHIVIPEDSTGGGVGLTRFKNWVAAAYPNTYIDVWTGMSSSNVLSGTYNNGDGKHINQAGNDYIASTIVASGKLSPITSRFQSVRSSDDQILLQGSNIKLKYRLNPKTNYIPRWSDTENLVPGLLVDDGTKLTTNGTINFYGTANGATFVDRNSTNTNNAFSFYNQSAYLRLFNNYLATDIMLWDNGANPKMGFGKAPGNLSSFMPVTVNIWGTDAMQLPYGTTAQRPTADTGYMRYNITTNAWEASKGLTYYDVQQGLSGSATLDFTSTAAQNSADLTITVTGAADGDPVVLGVPNAAVSANSSFTAWVSAANTVTVRFNNYSTGAIDPASGTFTVRVIK